MSRERNDIDNSVSFLTEEEHERRRSDGAQYVKLSYRGREKVTSLIDTETPEQHSVDVTLGPQDIIAVSELESREHDTATLFGSDGLHPVFGTVAIASAAGGLGGYIVSTLNYAEKQGVHVADLVSPSEIGGAVIVLAIASFWLGVLLHKHTGGDQG